MNSMNNTINNNKLNILQEHLEVNLDLLRNVNPQLVKVIFTEDRVEEFETLAYQLLMMINPTECQKQIPWPLIKTEKKLHHEFLQKFSSFIKMLNLDIPNITMSHFREANRKKLMQFLYKLSTLALETQLKEMMSPEEQNMMVPKQLPSKTKCQKLGDHKVKLSIIRGACYEESKALKKIQEYTESSKSKSEDLKKLKEKTEGDVWAKTEILASVVQELEVSSEMKSTLCDLEDLSGISAYNNETMVKEEELKMACKQVIQIQDLAAESLKLSNKEEFYLNGKDLTLVCSFDKTNLKVADSAMCENGNIRITEVIKSFNNKVLKNICHEWDVEEGTGEKPLYEEAQEILSRANQNQIESSKIHKTLTSIIEDHELFVSGLRKNQKQKIKRSKISTTIKKVSEKHSLNFVLPTSADDLDDLNSSIVKGKTRRSLNTIIHKKQTLSCSYKNKQGFQRPHSTLKVPQLKYRKSFNKRSSLTKSQVTGGSLQNRSPEFKLPLATSSPDVIGSGTYKRLKVASFVSSTPPVSMLRHLNAMPHQAGPSSTVLVAAPTATTTKGSGRNQLSGSYVAIATEDKKTSTAVRRSSRHQSPFVKKLVTTPTMTIHGTQESCEPGTSSEGTPTYSRSNRKSLDDIIKRYIRLKENIKKTEIVEKTKESDTEET